MGAAVWCLLVETHSRRKMTQSADVGSAQDWVEVVVDVAVDVAMD
jgi:hypothetical protein